MRGTEYTRTMRHPTLVGREGYARDALHDVVQSMGALSWMVRCMLLVDVDEAAGPDMAEGVYKLLDQQTAMLNGIYEELGAEEVQRATDDEARGIVDQSTVPTEALLDEAHKLRVQFIESNTKAGVDAALIGSALNLSGADVRRVIGRLRGEQRSEPVRPAKRA